MRWLRIGGISIGIIAGLIVGAIIGILLDHEVINPLRPGWPRVVGSIVLIPLLLVLISRLLPRRLHAVGTTIGFIVGITIYGILLIFGAIAFLPPDGRKLSTPLS